MEVRPAAFRLSGRFRRGMAGKSVSGRCHAIFSALDMPDTREEAPASPYGRLDAFRQERRAFPAGEGGAAPRAVGHRIRPGTALPGHAPLPGLAGRGRAAEPPPAAAARAPRPGAAPGRERRPSLAVVDEQPVRGGPAFGDCPGGRALAGRLLAAELRAILRLEAFREREIAQQHDKLRTIFLREDRDDCLVLREGLHDLLAEPPAGLSHGCPS